MTDFIQGPASEKHSQIIEVLTKQVLNKFLNYQHIKTDTQHLPTGQTFVYIVAGFNGSPHIDLQDCRHIVIGKNGGLTLINSKFKSKKNTKGHHAALWTPTR